MEEKEWYTKIPQRTWQWLGVNGAPLPKEDMPMLEKRQIVVDSGKEETVFLTAQQEGRGEVEILLSEGARLSLTQIQLLPDTAVQALSIKVRAAAGASFRFTAVEAGAASSLTKLDVRLMGEAAEADLATVYFGDGQRSLDLNYRIRQEAPKTKARMQVEGVLLGHSQKIFRGTLDFSRGSKGSVGREKEAVMLLSPTVRNRSVPLMLSGEDAVDGHHAVSVGKLEEEKLFYLMSRGLDLPEARRLIVEAAFQPVLERISRQNLREEAANWIQRRLANDNN